MFCEKCGNELADGAKFCSRCGKSLTSDIPVLTDSKISDEVRKSYRKKAWFWGLGPILVFILTIFLWGIVNLFAGTNGSDSDVVTFINNILIPFVIGLNFLAFPLGIVLAIYYGNKAND
jgi:uncharacterized membrane protein YvbJ